MKAIGVLDATTDGQVIVVTARNGGHITLLGSSCPASLRPREEGASLSLSPQQDGDVVAIKVSWLEPGKHGTWHHCHHILAVTKIGGSYRIELEKEFIPKSDRLGQIILGTGLAVRYGEESFLAPLLLSGYKDEEKLAELSKIYHLLPQSDGNLLCRFLIGTVELGELHKAAADLVIEKVDVPALKQELKSVQDAYMNNLKCLNEKEDQFKAYSADVEKERKRVQKQNLEDLLLINALKKSIEVIVESTREILNTGCTGLSRFGAKNKKLRRIADLMDQTEAQTKKPA